MFCSKCGKLNPDGAKFCTACGSPLSSSQQQPGGPDFTNPNASGNFGQPRRFMAPIKKRDIVLAIVLSLLTCGIYSIIWFISMADDLNTATGRNDTSGGVAFILELITCSIYLYFWYYKAGEKVDEIRVRNGEPSNSSGVVYLILAIFGFSIISDCLIQSELNKVAALQ